MTSTTTRAHPVPADEQKRLRSLADCGVIGSPPLPDLPSVVELTAYVCGVPNAVVNIISATHQHQPASCSAPTPRCGTSPTRSATT